MTIRQLPEIKAFERPEGLESQPSADAIGRWDLGVKAANDGDDNSISIYDVIGEDWMGGGTTSKRIAAALRSIGKKDVVVNINSPGGDMFEGISIYNLLRAHEGKITMRIMGLAASAASIIAMAGDTVQIARSGFLMVHNCWVMAMGNRHDMREIADWLEPFDAAMAGVYVAHAGMTEKEAAKLMDNETWIGGKEAIDLGLAEEYLPADQMKDDPAARLASKDVLATRRVEAVLADKGIPRHERRSLIAGVKGIKLDADPSATLDAGGRSAIALSLRQLQSNLKF